ncbi:MAG: hypothetical protein P8175_12680 [Deltaproteobacteria bacterium]
MRNPFLDFHSLPYEKKEIPLDRIVRAKQEIMDSILEGYLHLVEEEVKDLVWLVEHSHVVRTYRAAVNRIRELHYDQDDIEEFCAELLKANLWDISIDTTPGGAGIKFSGVRIVCYNRPDLISGGRLVVEGSVGNWCGAGMMNGQILVTGYAGQKTGEWMRGGEIHVDGSVGSLGKSRFGGKIYQRGKPVVPQELEGQC